MIIVPDIWDLGDGLAGDLCDAGAVVALPLAIIMLHNGREGLSRVRDWRQAGKIRVLEQEQAAMRRHYDAKFADLFGAMGEVVSAAGGNVPVDLQKTQPQVIPIRGRRTAG